MHPDRVPTRLEIRRARRAAAKADGPFVRSMTQAWNDYRAARASGLPKDDADRGLTEVVREIWPRKRSAPWKSHCDACQDTGLRRVQVKTDTYEYDADYVEPCPVRRGPSVDGGAPTTAPREPSARSAEGGDLVIPWTPDAYAQLRRDFESPYRDRARALWLLAAATIVIAAGRCPLMTQGAKRGPSRPDRRVVAFRCVCCGWKRRHTRVVVAHRERWQCLSCGTIRALDASQTLEGFMAEQQARVQATLDRHGRHYRASMQAHFDASEPAGDPAIVGAGEFRALSLDEVSETELSGAVARPPRPREGW